MQGFAESSPLLLWGWLFVVMLAFKIKQSPHIGEGAAEMRIAIERGELTTRAVVTDTPHGAAPARWVALLASAALARAYTIAVLGAVFSAFAIEKIAGRVTYVSIIVGLCVSESGC